MKLIKQLLQAALSPQELSIQDESHKHAKHAGAMESGGGHYKLEIVASIFNNKSAIERHRMIYTALGETMGRDIHAISINAKTPEEAATKDG